MGFFKNLGKSIKGLTKMASIKNIVKVATGDAKGLAKEALGRTLSPHMRSGQKTPQVVENMAETYVQNQSTRLSNNIIEKASESKDFQGIAKFGTKLWFQTMWEAHKGKILIGLGVLTLGIVYLVRRKRPVGRRR